MPQGQTWVQTPWEYAQRDVDHRERMQARRVAMRKKQRIKYPESYAAVVEFNRAQGFADKADPKLKVLRSHRGSFKSKRPITLPKIQGSK